MLVQLYDRQAGQLAKAGGGNGLPRPAPTQDDYSFHPDQYARQHQRWRGGGGGEGGIRTHGPLQDTRFPVVPIRPLSHPSRATQANLWGAPVAPCGGRVLRNGSP